jgi:hypothetical protein
MVTTGQHVIPTRLMRLPQATPAGVQEVPEEVMVSTRVISPKIR